jgi:hypothetical protein
MPPITHAHALSMPDVCCVVTGRSYQSRNSFSGPNGLDEAVEWAEAQFLGYGFETTRIPFREDMTPQVVATLRGTVAPDSVVFVGAHYDSRGTQNSSPTQRAPGGEPKTADPPN